MKRASAGNLQPKSCTTLPIRYRTLVFAFMSKKLERKDQWGVILQTFINVMFYTVTCLILRNLASTSAKAQQIEQRRRETAVTKLFLKYSFVASFTNSLVLPLSKNKYKCVHDSLVVEKTSDIMLKKHSQWANSHRTRSWMRSSRKAQAPPCSSRTFPGPQRSFWNKKKHI